MKSKSIVRATPDLVPAVMSNMTGTWFPGSTAACGLPTKPINKPAIAAFADPAATASSTEAARRAVISSMRRDLSKYPPKTVVSATSFVEAGMPVYPDVSMDMKKRNKAKVMISAATRTISNLKEAIALNPRLSVFIGG